MQIALFLLLAYLIGSIPFGFIVGRIFNVDITAKGSGNIGFTNVLRVLGPIPGTIVLILDLLKGTLATYLGILYLVDPWLVVACGVMAILGHMFPIFLGFKGGKGAAIGLGVLLALAPDIFAIAAILVILVIALTRYVSLASTTIPLVLAGLMYILDRPLPYVIATTLVAVMMIIKHIPNIKRLLAGTERKFGEPADE